MIKITPIIRPLETALPELEKECQRLAMRRFIDHSEFLLNAQNLQDFIKNWLKQRFPNDFPHDQVECRDICLSPYMDTRMELDRSITDVRLKMFNCIGVLEKYVVIHYICPLYSNESDKWNVSLHEGFIKYKFPDND